jgi:hypothetical protein
LPLFELGEEALDAPALAVGDAVVAVLVSAVAARRDNRLAAFAEGQLVQTGNPQSLNRHYSPGPAHSTSRKT